MDQRTRDAVNAAMRERQADLDLIRKTHAGALVASGKFRRANMTYVLINYAPDGTHNQTFKTKKAALAAVTKFLGYQAEGDGPWYGDWGNRLVVEERAAGHTARTETALYQAFNARECGTATKRQLAFLEKKGF